MSMGYGGSSGGTSTASPLVAGKMALIQSRAIDQRGEPLQTEEMKQILHRTAEPPRKTQVNIIPGISPSGWDARFGYGEVEINKALAEV
jgi:subtilase family serine protease